MRFGVWTPKSSRWALTGVLGFMFIVSVSCQEGPLVTVVQGTLLGTYESSRDGRIFNRFRGVPYGKVVRRFDVPAPPESWEGIKNATVSAPECINPNQYGQNPGTPPGVPYGIEDCLFLELSTPYLPTDENFTSPMPVMVWITGGGFNVGSGNPHGPKYLMDEDIVYVTLNFRLGAFGLLNAGVERARGNQALKDIVQSLKWIQENIDRFGGDKNSVTVFGESTGGGGTSLLTLSPMAKGLFHKAIMQSGVANNPAMITRSNPAAQKDAKRFAAALDCPTRDVEAMLDCLIDTPAEEVAALSLIVTDELGNWIADGIHMGPTIETFSFGTNDPNVFLAEDPEEIAKRGDFTPIPMMIGQIAQEAFSPVQLFFSDPEIVEVLNREFGRRLPQFLMYWSEAITPDPCAVTGKLREYFFDGGNLTADSAYDYERMWADRLFSQPVRTMADAYAKYTHVYMFNFTRSKAGENFPPSHADDVYYMFDLPSGESFGPSISEIKPGDGDYQFSKDFIRSLVTFAKEGKPSAWGSPAPEWKPLTPGQLQEWLQVSDEAFMQVVDQQFTDSWAFWNSLDLKVV